jgi:aryl-alcohol dehydrogenase-like predicted oxidoreductase
VLGRRGVTSVIAGPRTADQLGDYLAAAELRLPRELARKLSDVSRRSP